MKLIAMSMLVFSLMPCAHATPLSKKSVLQIQKTMAKMTMDMTAHYYYKADAIGHKNRAVWYAREHHRAVAQLARLNSAR